MMDEFKIDKDEAMKVETPKPPKPAKVEKPKPEPVEGWEAKLKVASAKAVAREFKRRGWKTAANIEAHFREAKQVFIQLNVQNLLAAIKEDK